MTDATKAQPVARLDELCHALLMAKRALEESAELVYAEYATDWRHGSLYTTLEK